MAENFDLIFGQNASQQYAWSDNDYQNGWETIGNIPPTAAQFDALQRRSDTKMKELNDELTPLVNADTADSRQPSTAYSVDDIKYSPLLPTGWFLTCTVAGTTSASEIVLPTPIAENDTVTDGTVTWEIHKIGTGNGGDGVPLGAIIAYSANGELPSGYLLCDGSAVSRDMFPDLFAAIGTTYGAGDGSTTFNVPDYNTAQRFVQGSTVAGTVKQAGLPNIEGGLFRSDVESNNGYSQITSYNDGAFFADSTARSTNIGINAGTGYQMRFDASLSNPIYGNSTTVQPYSLTCRYIIKAYDGVTPTPAEADISNIFAEIARLQLPTGTIIPTANDVASPGFLICDGSAVSRETYSVLFSAIGTKYGEGDGSTTFNLPDSTLLVKSTESYAPVGIWDTASPSGLVPITAETNPVSPTLGTYGIAANYVSSQLCAVLTGHALPGADTTTLMYAKLPTATASNSVKNQIKYS